MSRAPDFLVIGAQKCGSTTLFEDLRAHPRVRMLEKEASPLVTSADERSYRARFRWSDYVVGDVSTQYSMRPEVDVVDAAAAWAPRARIVYIVREPLSRVISHHHHDLALGLVDADIDRAVYEHPPLVQNSRYATQLRPWVDAFGLDRVHVIRFEDYVARREIECARLCRFLDLEPHTFDSSLVANAATNKLVATGRWARLSRNGAYRKVIRPLMSDRLRRRLMRAALPQAPPRPPAPSAATMAELVAILQPEVDGLAALLERPAWWDLAEAARRLVREHDTLPSLGAREEGVRDA